MNSSNSADSLMASLILLVLSPLIFIIGHGVGRNSVHQEYNQIMSKELAKGCIKQPSNCKIYQDYYNAVENQK